MIHGHSYILSSIFADGNKKTSKKGNVRGMYFLKYHRYVCNDIVLTYPCLNTDVLK